MLQRNLIPFDGGRPVDEPGVLQPGQRIFIFPGARPFPDRGKNEFLVFTSQMFGDRFPYCGQLGELSGCE